MCTQMQEYKLNNLEWKCLGSLITGKSHFLIFAFMYHFFFWIFFQITKHNILKYGSDNEVTTVHNLRDKSEA